MGKRVFNFGAGPCALPLSVLEEAQAEFTNYKNSGMSVIELSHRGKEYEGSHDEAMQLAKEVYGTPTDFEVLFIQGGATLQFAMIPMNLLKKGGKKGAYVCCGEWAGKAFKEGAIYGDVYAAWDGKSEKYIRMPKNDEIKLQPDTAYLHITTNETIGGIRTIEWPDVNVPLIADMSSDFMTRPIPWEKFDIVYGGVQKNLGPSGMAVVFVRKSALAAMNKNIGTYFRYDVHCDNKSLYNTPPVFSIYIMGKVLKWMKSLGGLSGIQKIAENKASVVYNAIDGSSGYYNCPVVKEYRSIMNIVFRLSNPTLEEKFLSEAKKADLIGLKGHRSVGGCRASCYNAVPMEAVVALKNFMEKFHKENPV